MTTYETVVGLEIHVELSTESKLFCSCPTAFGGRPNSHTCPVCTGMPGTLPVLNRRALELAPDRIDLVGVTGSRLDHVMGNLQLLALGLESGVPMFILDAHNRIRLIDRPLTIKKEEQFGEYISLIPHGGLVGGLTLKGMKYLLSGATLTPDISLGISNEIIDEEAQIIFTVGRLFVFETRD